MLLLKRFKHKSGVLSLSKQLEDRKDFFFVSFVSLMFILSACSRLSGCFREDVYCAGLVTDVLGINDHGMNQDTWVGLEEAKTNRLVDRIEYIESVDTRDYEKNIAYFAENGYDVIITTGIGLRDETLRSADLYPDSPQGAVPVSRKWTDL